MGLGISMGIKKNPMPPCGTRIIEENRIASSDVYTRPEEFLYKNKKYKVPKVLLSGNHAEIEKWRKMK